MEIGIWIFKCSFGQIWFQDSNTTNVSEESQNNKNITTKHISCQLQLGWLNIWYLYTLLLILRDISVEQLVLFTVWPLLPAYTLEHKTYCLFIALMSQQMFKMSTIICYISKWAQACNTYSWCSQAVSYYIWGVNCQFHEPVMLLNSKLYQFV